MFGLDLTVLAIIALVGLTAGLILYFVLYESFANEAKQAERIQTIHSQDNAAARAKLKAKQVDVAKRRQNVQETLKEIEGKQKSKSTKSLKNMLHYANVKMSQAKFYSISIIFGLFITFFAFIFGAHPLVVLAVFFASSFGIPRFILARKIKKRMNAFLDEFPNAVDVIVRGIKAGLPLNDCMKIVSTEARDPVATEFKKIMDNQQMGIPMSQAVLKIYDSVPLTEANFFAIVIALQQSTGGNLSESLGNLSNVLRDRKKMKAKIVALSTEAKTSAGIIGALPILVGLAVYVITPDYISVLFTDRTGNILLGCAASLMMVGVLVMRKMINFDF